MTQKKGRAEVWKVETLFSFLFFTIKLLLGTLSRLSRVEWDIDGHASKVQSEFHSFINSTMMDQQRTREEEEITILDE